ncbi:hypothetical protein BB559_001022 [Furculomyces boomerangus]|uniref:Thioredoxin n=2 Tax=Harpellales TaxID=61421 RepID=A0A2T9YHJ5_9FUNG|nr:hypothetical protein BB559_003983 [Furculomyces boomerangus]PVU99067.1 hypothetical protein BB559_001022 [Furculomyces boomerangus]PWA02966.1 hypothetical protein BB558_000876 [Smittium angustum]
MTVIEITSKAQYDSIIAEGGLVVVDFHAVWCGPCKMIAPKIKEFSAEFPNVKFLKVDVDQLSDIAEEVGISAMPTLKYYKNGVLIDEVVGANVMAIRNKIVQNN